MNTVISAMALDYPADKLNVYLSDDAGASVTLNGIKEARVYASWWVPFCRRYKIKQICPKAYFSEPEEENQSGDFSEHRQLIKEKFEVFKQRVRNWTGKGHVDGDENSNAKDHSSVLQVLQENAMEDNPDRIEMPTLVYVSREKRLSHPHHFKAGALNVLLRISSLVSNSPYILVLDCDMYCNDPISARQAMCLHVDPHISRTLGWVQYPQKFHNVSKNDIYDSQIRHLWLTYWPGADGIQGPVISGTNVYIKRKALYDIDIQSDAVNGVVNDLIELRDAFGPSNEFIKSLSHNERPDAIKRRGLCSILSEEAQYLASCTYEEDTQWGKKVGFLYYSVVEDAMTGFVLQSKGWRSMYLNPARPQFLGSATTNLNEYLIQNTRWATGLIDISLCKYSPLLYTSSRIQLFQRMCNSWISLFPLDFIPASCFAIIPPICFFYGVSIYPKLSDPFIIPFAFAFLASQLRHLFDVLTSGGSRSIRAWCNEERIWMIKGVTCFFYGVLDSVMINLGFREASFIPTNKAGDDEWYHMGKYDIRTSNIFLVPLVTTVPLNLTCFVGGAARVILSKNMNDMFAQLVLSFYGLVMRLPVIQGMFMRQDNGRITSTATLISILLTAILLSFGYLML